MEVIAKTSTNLSTFRTKTTILNYCDVESDQDICEAFAYANANSLPVYVLGGGSNTFFENNVTRTFVIKNRIPKKIQDLGDGRYYCSSSVHILKFLNFLLEKSLDAPYHLASLPAEIGGILAMNAGRGSEGVYNYVESVDFIDGNGRKMTRSVSDLNVSYRHTFFLDNPFAFILGAVFHFHKKDFGNANPIIERINFSKTHQDLSAPNVGCFYSPLCNRWIIYFCSKIFRFGKARFSRKEKLWLLNSSINPAHLRRLTHFVRFLHTITFSRYSPEARIVT